MADHTHEYVLSACHSGRHSMCPRRLTYVAGGGGECVYLCTCTCHGTAAAAATAGSSGRESSNG